MNHAISPQEAQEQRQKQIPQEVFDVWNEVIVSHLCQSSQRIVSRFLLKELSSKLSSKMHMNFETLKEKGYLDLEPFFRENGWTVDFDSPGYNESYDANFQFSAKKY
jgi:hypothetical protein